MPRVEMYSFGLTATRGVANEVVDDMLVIERAPDVTLRPHRLLTNVEKPEQVIIRDLCIGGHSQLCGPIDAYLFSYAYYKAVQDAFTKEHKLEGKSDAEIQDYLDDNDLAWPTPGRIDLPTVPKGTPVRVVGQFLDPALKTFALFIVGPAFREAL